MVNYTKLKEELESWKESQNIRIHIKQVHASHYNELLFVRIVIRIIKKTGYLSVLFVDMSRIVILSGQGTS